MTKLLNNTTKTVTVRLSQSDYVDLVAMSEKNNSSVADTIRKAWRAFHQQINTTNERALQTQELKKFIFECISLSKGWDTSQRQKAIQRINGQLKQATENEK